MLRVDEAGHPGQWGTNAPVGKNNDSGNSPRLMGGSQPCRMAPDKAAAGSRLLAARSRGATELPSHLRMQGRG